MTTALLIVDIQNDYFAGGKMALAGSDAAAAQAATLLARFRDDGAPVFHLQHVSLRPNATFFIPGTQGVKIHARVQPAAGETLIEKHYPNGFRETPLLERLKSRGVERVVIAGMMTHMCIDTTTRAAADHGFECVLAHDACATRDLAFGETKVAAHEVQGAFLAALNGAFAKVLGTKEILANVA